MKTEEERRERRRFLDRERYKARNPNPNPRGVPAATEKVCPTCNILKVRSEYYKKGKGVSYHCKPCTRAQQIELRKDPEYRAARYAQKRQYYKETAGWRSIKKKKFYAENADAIRAEQSKYYAENKEELGCKRRERYKTDPEFRMKLMYASKRLKRATPKWVDRAKVKEVYLSRPEGYEVDHIIPLNNPLVCGLHVHENLQHLTCAENAKKNNLFEV